MEEEERQHNEQNLITVVSDSVSSIMLFSILVQKTRGRQAIFNTISRLFEGLSDIAKAVMIILIADTLLGYHSEEGWTGFLELVLGHYGVEAGEEGVVIFVGVVSAGGAVRVSRLGQGLLDVGCPGPSLHRGCPGPSLRSGSAPHCTMDLRCCVTEGSCCVHFTLGTMACTVPGCMSPSLLSS